MNDRVISGILKKRQLGISKKRNSSWGFAGKNTLHFWSFEEKTNNHRNFEKNRFSAGANGN